MSMSLEEYNEKMKVFKSLIEKTKKGDVDSTRILREFVKQAVDDSPNDYLVTLAQGLYDLRKNYEKGKSEEN